MITREVIPWSERWGIAERTGDSLARHVRARRYKTEDAAKAALIKLEENIAKKKRDGAAKRLRAKNALARVARHEATLKEIQERLDSAAFNRIELIEIIDKAMKEEP